MYLELGTESQMSLINTLKSKESTVEPCGTTDLTRNENESAPEIRTRECR
jgi:hypothetical protein